MKAVESASKPEPEGERLVRHPLQGKLQELGYVPILDRKDDAHGRRYAVASSAYDHGEGMVVRNELETLTRRPAERRPRPPRRIGQQRSISRDLELRLVNSKPEELIDVTIALTRRREDAMTPYIHRRMAEGAIRIQSDLDTERDTFIRARKARHAKSTKPVVQRILELGGSVPDPEPGRIFMATVPAGMVPLLAATPGVEQVDEVQETAPLIHGEHIREGHQLNQYIQNGYNGSVSGGVDIRFAIADGQGINDEHLGWNIQSRWNCTQSGCVTRDPWGFNDDPLPGDENGVEGEEGPHMTGVASLIVGSGSSAQNSGYATGARGHFYRGNGTEGGYIKIFQHIRNTVYNRARVINLSVGYGGDAECTGTTNRAKDVNDTFDDGILHFNSAGNSGTGSGPEDCTVGATASAIGAFVVGAAGNQIGGGNTNNVKDDGIAGYSARGGTSTEGAGRTIIDIVAYGGRAQMFDMGTGFTYSASGTSFAAPTVVGAAIEMLDHWSVNGFSGVTTEPGFLAAALLLQGDRQGASAKLTTKFDNRWGAGRLHARRFDSAGMDDPWGRYFAWFCVEDGESIEIEMNGGAPVPADVNTAKGVVRWVDRYNHEMGSDINDIDLRVTVGGTSTRTSASDWDNKERVRSWMPSTAETLMFTVIGNDISGEDPICGTDSQLVHVAFLYEDGDRDDGDDSDGAAEE